MASEARQRALTLIREFGWNNTSFQTLEPFFEYWFDPSGKGVVAYYRAWGTWVVAGAPICPLDRIVDCTLLFVAAATEAGYRVCFFGTAARYTEQIGQHATHVKIGEQPCWNPARWENDAKRMQVIGSQCRRAKRKDVSVKQVSSQVMAEPGSHERQQAERVITQWQHSHKMATMSFLVHLEAFSFASERRYFLAERLSEAGDAEAVGFLSVVPVYARDGFFFEDLLRTPTAPNGTTEALMDAAMRALAVEGKSFVTLGLSPLRNIDYSNYPQPRWATAVFKISKRFFDPLYSFEGLAAYKAKLRPEEWEEIYVTGIPKFTFSMLIAVLMAFVRSHPTRFAVDTLLRLLTTNLRRVPAPTWRRVNYALALTLSIWIGILGQSDGSYWFGSQRVLAGWLAFDCLMVGVLVSLGHSVGRKAGHRSRHRAKFMQWLTPLALLAVLGDVCLTSWQTLQFFMTHPWSWWSAFAWAIAVSGPLIATLLLAGMLIALHSQYPSQSSRSQSSRTQS